MLARSLLAASAVVACSLFTAAPAAHAIDEEHQQMARQMIDKAIQHGEVTFARNKKDAFGPVQGQLIDQNASAMARFCFPGHVS